MKQEDGAYRCSPFHVRFGKLGVIRSKEKIIDIEINGQRVDFLHMMLGEAGEAFFIERLNTAGEMTSSTMSSVVSTNELNSLVTENKLTISTCSELNEAVSSTTASLQVSLGTSETASETIKSMEFDLDIESNEVHSQKMTSTKPIPISRSHSTAENEFVSNDSSLSPLLSPENTVSKVNDSPMESKPNVNFFSDGDITPELTSPAISRPSTPKSDTELEITKTKRKNSVSASEANQWNWNWGQLPERQNNNKNFDKNNNFYQPPTMPIELPAPEQPIEIVKTKEVSASGSSKLLGGMFKLGNKNDIGGIYLDETEKLDSEVADLYLNQKSNSHKLTAISQTKICVQTNPLPSDDDQESGNGQSLPQSPVKDFCSVLGDIQMSLCGFIMANNSNATVTPQPIDSNLNRSPSSSSNLLTIASSVSPSMRNSLSVDLSPSKLLSTTQIQANNFDDLFQQYAVSYDKFMDELNTITKNPNLVIKINNKYMNWESAAPLILSAVVFHKQLPAEAVNSIMETHMPKAVKQLEEKKATSSSAAGSGSWGKNLFGWGKKASTPPTADVAASASLQQKTVTTTTTTTVTTTTVQQTTNASASILVNKLHNMTDSDEYGIMFNEDLISPPVVKVDNTETKLRSKTLDPKQLEATKPFMTIEQPPQPAPQQSVDSSVDFNEFIQKKELYRKSTRLSSELIQKLGLKMGSNEIQYSITTALQGTTRITSYIFLWNHDDKIIVSDIDGTITKSDVWGQVLPIFGRDWSQNGVADLFTAIERNQYKFMYLSARAIGQSKITRDLLKNINQDGFTLPEGPLLVTPTSLFVAFQKEVIERKPEEFKISCLNDIKSLFPMTNNEPFYAGYGNKITDVTAYKAVGIPVPRIFTINPQGELKHEVSRTFQSSYSKLCDCVDLIFPPFRVQAHSKPEYNAFAYWRDTTSFSSLSIDSEINEALRDVAKEEKSAKGKSKAALSVQALPQSISSSQLNEPDRLKN